MVADTQLDEIEQKIEGLRERLDSCHQAMTLSRAAIWIGGGVLALVLTFAVNYRTPAIVFGAVSAVLGGTVWFGANKTSHEDVERELADVEARKAKLFDEVALRNGWRDMTPTVH